jgi:hypothetical protein
VLTGQQPKSQKVPNDCRSDIATSGLALEAANTIPRRNIDYAGKRLNDTAG